jgi:hypothetical protein
MKQHSQSLVVISRGAFRWRANLLRNRSGERNSS